MSRRPPGARPHVSPAARGSRPAPSGEVEVLYGLRAVEAVVAVRGAQVRELWFDPHVVEPRVVTRLVATLERSRVRDSGLGQSRPRAPGGPIATEHPRGELEAACRSDLHEGLVAFVAPRTWLPARELPRVLGGRGFAVALDRVRNPYNVGALLRTAAFFGVDAVVLGAPAPHPALAADAVRVAEGGAEHVQLARTTDLVATLTQLRQAGVAILGGESDGDADGLAYVPTGPTVLVLGHEREGLSERVRACCDRLVAIHGVGAVASLNVAIAGSLLIASMARASRRAD